MLKSILHNKRIATLTLVTGLAAFVISGIMASAVRRTGVGQPQIASTQSSRNLSATPLGWSTTVEAHEMGPVPGPMAP